MKAILITTIALFLSVFASSKNIELQVEHDNQIKNQVITELKQKGLEQQVAEIRITNGVVILDGKVKNAYTKMKIIETVLSINGVSAVEDELEVVAAETPEDLIQQLISKVLTYPHYTVFDDINFQIQDTGLVVLTGYVTMEFKIDEIAQRVGSITGVRNLTISIETLSSSQSANQLRETLFNNIYGHSLFFTYAHRSNPPIHIIVDGADVMLTGAVRNRIEYRQAESIARNTFGVIRVDNKLQISP